MAKEKTELEASILAYLQHITPLFQKLVNEFKQVCFDHLNKHNNPQLKQLPNTKETQ